MQPKGRPITQKHRYFLILSIVALLGFAIWWIYNPLKDFDWTRITSTLASLDPGWTVAGIALANATYIGRALRWRILVLPLEPRPSLWRILRGTLIGFTAIVLLGRPGEFVRPYLIARSEKVPLASQFAAWGIERIFDLLAALAIFGIGLSRVNQSASHPDPAMAWIFRTGGTLAWVISVLCLGILIVFGLYSDLMRKRLMDALSFLRSHHLERVERLVSTFVKGFEIVRRPSSMLAMVLYTVFEWVLIAGSYFCIMRAFGDVQIFRWIDILILVGFTAFGSVIQLPGIGGGTQAVTVIVLRELFAVPLEVAVTVAMTLWLITFVTVVPIGIPLALHEGLNWKRLRAIRKEVESEGL